MSSTCRRELSAFSTADGSEIEQCGNGARCVAWVLAREKLTRMRTFSLESPAGLIEATVLDDDHRSTVNMGPPVNSNPALRSRSSSETSKPIRYDLDVDGESFSSGIGVLSMGNPHCVHRWSAACDSSRRGQAGYRTSELNTIRASPRPRTSVSCSFWIDRATVKLRVSRAGRRRNAGLWHRGLRCSRSPVNELGRLDARGSRCNCPEGNSW